MSRYRNERLYVMVTKEEKEAIKQKMSKLGMTNLGDFVRLCLTVNPIVHIDVSKINELIYEINKIGVNINQIAKAANTSKNVYQSDIEDVKQQLDKLNKFIKIIGKNLREVR
ncbi:MAG: MobC family plasmid mobilization relaxosome protein [Clostridiales bacterium]|nr:MobC family plasmid mobilization relaxosome protein [Clostridiales bacterium]